MYRVHVCYELMQEDFRFMKANKDDPVVELFHAESKKKHEKEQEERVKALAAFDPDSLEEYPEAIWLINLEHVGMSDEAIYEPGWGDESSTSQRDGPPVRLFQMFCYIKEGPDDGEVRYVEEYEGPPTSKRIEE